MKLGKLPATRDPRDLLFARYRTAALTPAPIGFDHTSLITTAWGMLGNDKVGDCAIAGPAHETMLLNAEAGKQVLFDEASVLGAYSAITGYNPADPSTDQGSNVRDVLKYRSTLGLPDASGARHTIGAYVALTLGDWNQLLEALYIFECVGVGIRFPASAMDQFNAGKPWDIPISAIEGGHYIPVVARRTPTSVTVVTWGKEQEMTEAFYAGTCDEAWAFVSSEDLTSGRTLEGFDLAGLTQDLNVL